MSSSGSASSERSWIGDVSLLFVLESGAIVVLVDCLLDNALVGFFREFCSM